MLYVRPSTALSQSKIRRNFPNNALKLRNCRKPEKSKWSKREERYSYHVRVHVPYGENVHDAHMTPLNKPVLMLLHLIRLIVLYCIVVVLLSTKLVHLFFTFSRWIVHWMKHWLELYFGTWKVKREFVKMFFLVFDSHYDGSEIHQRKHLNRWN